MKTKSILGWTVCCLALIFSSCQKENINSVPTPETQLHDQGQMAFEDAPQSKVDLASLNFSIEDGILTFSSEADLENYAYNIALLNSEELRQFENEHGFQSWLNKQESILEQAQEIVDPYALETFAADNAAILSFDMETGLTFHPQPFLSIVNADKIYKLKNQYVYVDAQKALIATNLALLKQGIEDQNFQDADLYRAEVTTTNFSSSERTDGVTGNCSSLDNSFFDQHYYPHGGDGSDKRLILDVRAFSFPNPNTSGGMQTDINYVSRNEQRFFLPGSNVAMWRLSSCFMLSEMRIGNLDIAEKGVFSIQTIDLIFLGQNQTFLRNFDWILASIWNPDWHRVGCRI